MLQLLLIQLFWLRGPIQEKRIWRPKLLVYHRMISVIYWLSCYSTICHTFLWQARLDILKIHSRKMNLTRGINLRKIAELMPGSSGAEVKVLFFFFFFSSNNKWLYLDEIWSSGWVQFWEGHIDLSTLKVTYEDVVKVSAISFNSSSFFFLLFKIRLLKFSASHNTALSKMQQRIFDVSFCRDRNNLYYHNFSRAFAQKLGCTHWGKEGFMSRKKTLKWLSQRWVTSKLILVDTVNNKKKLVCVRINVLENTYCS